MFEFSGLPMFSRHRPKAVASVIMSASAAIVGLMSVAIARDDAGVRQFLLDQSAPDPVGRAAFRATAPADASESGLSLTIRGLTRVGAGPVVASRKTSRKQRLAARPPIASRAAAKARNLLFAADPFRPAVVSIYEDTTLRRGDAVMTLKGLRVFAGSRTFPYRPEDFATLTASRNIKFEFRRALIELDQVPAVRG